MNILHDKWSDGGETDDGESEDDAAVDKHVFELVDNESLECQRCCLAHLKPF